MELRMNSGEDEAHEFLNNFEDLLARQLPVASEMEGWVRRIVRETKGDRARRHLHSRRPFFSMKLCVTAYGAMAGAAAS
jgi:hypothetical protein